jgi:transposase
MEGIVLKLSNGDKQRLSIQARACSEARLKTRYLIILNLDEGVGPTEVARRLKVSRSTVYRVAERFCECGEAGLIDRREENGDRKLDEQTLAVLHEIVEGSPQDFGWPRPTWTRELLVAVLHQQTGVKIDVSTMSRALALIGARRGQPKPVVACPWSKRAKNQRIRELQQLEQTLPDDEVLVYEDEVDIHLNPKIGPDWMVRGQQKTVVTPGRNEKRYLAGARDARTGELIWAEGEKKNSLLFLWLLRELVQHYADAKVIHVILDNYCIHKTKQVETALATPAGGRLRLHFLPPYCPDHNRIERDWRDLHANVTRNHTCGDMIGLMRNVRRYLKQHNKQINQTQTAA